MASEDENLEEIDIMADELGITEFPDLVPQLLDFISKKSRESETFFFTEGGRKGYIICKYVPNGTYLYGSGSRPGEPVLNITHIVIQKNNGEKNIVDRISREVLERSNIKGVRVESILSPEWADSFKLDWITQNENSKVLFKGGKTKTKRKRKKFSVRRRRRKPSA